MNPYILVIDDSIDLLQLYKTALELDGYEVRTAQNARQAFEALAERMPDLILLDVQMPEISGPQLLDQIIARVPELLQKTKVIYASAAEAPVDSRVTGSILKTSGLDVLSTTVERALKRG